MEPRETAQLVPLSDSSVRDLQTQAPQTSSANDSVVFKQNVVLSPNLQVSPQRPRIGFNSSVL